MFCPNKQRSVVSAFSRDLLRWGTQIVGRLWVGNSRVGVGGGGGGGIMFMACRAFSIYLAHFG